MNSFYVYANWKASEKIVMDLDNYTENACTRNASKTCTENPMLHHCNKKVFSTSAICKFVALLKNSKGRAGLNAY